MPEPVVITRWKHDEAPTDATLESRLRRDGLTPSWWSNDPSDYYAPHEHDYHKVLYCAAGSITFILTPTSERIELHPGDRMDMPPGWPHAAIVGPEGVRCVEAQKPATTA
ncbi:MAG: AraC family ligand binding domain-containing protein [Dehalococcoidia bacterium]|nr:AraC family ligand binding domain-containing protein [Dehalococcoidia bacterium]